jgi:hypothetical protein
VRTDWILAAAALLCAGAAAADTKLTFVEEGSKKPGTTMTISSGRMRIDTPDSDGKYSVFDSKAQTLTNVDPSEKEYMVMDAVTMKKVGAKMADARKQMEARMASMPPEQRAAVERMMGGAMAPPGAPPKPIYKRTGKRSKVSGYDCEIVTYTVSKEAGEMCVAAPDALALSAADVATVKDFAAFLDHMTSPMAEMGLGGRMNFSEIGGMPVRTKDGGDPAEVVANISHDSVPASLFATPAGFTQKKLDLE